MAKQPRKASKSAQDTSKAQHARNPMLAVRVPRSVFRALRKAARDDAREFPDWFRRNVEKMLPDTSPAGNCLTVIKGSLDTSDGLRLNTTSADSAKYTFTAAAGASESSAPNGDKS